ncbi:MAG TPA: hypothetical protein VNV87_07130 [Acidimicrobiales bacterium]|jgi:hypothetical protein|nr:hypothetical protein [Acidimicrobiales bacterium]
MSDTLRNDEEAAVEFFLGVELFGAPEQCYNRVVSTNKSVQNDRFIGTFSYGNIPYDHSELNLRLCTKEVALA